MTKDAPRRWRVYLGFQSSQALQRNALTVVDIVVAEATELHEVFLDALKVRQFLEIVGSDVPVRCQLSVVRSRLRKMKTKLRHLDTIWLGLIWQRKFFNGSHPTFVDPAGSNSLSFDPTVDDGYICYPQQLLFPFRIDINLYQFNFLFI